MVTSTPMLTNGLDLHSPSTTRRPRSSSLSNIEESKLNRTHLRSHTESYNSDDHPLRSATSFAAETITRPHLNRVLGALDLSATFPSEEDDRLVSAINPTTPQCDETVVLIHETSSTDSLAGVALKYGITMAELRKANQLWATDSIHLRKSLYIPLDKTQPPAKSGRSTRSTSPSSDALTASLNGSSAIQRIPTSKLSFFPPPSNPSSLSLPADLDLPTQRQPHRVISPPRTLSTFLNSLPIAASTRDDIIARLSFDSSSSNTSTSDEQQHELDDVHTPKPHRHPPSPWTNSSKSKQKSSDADQGGSHDHVPSSTVLLDTLPRSSSAGIGLIPLRKSLSAFSDTPSGKQRAEWTGADEEAQRQTEVRTVQMEPSPSMQLPRPTRPRPGYGGF